MSITSKNRGKYSPNKTKKRRNCNKMTNNNYKTCKHQIYKSIYGGRYLKNLYF